MPSRSVLAIDPGRHLGFAFVPQGVVDTLILPDRPEEAVREALSSLRPYLLQTSLLVVEGWEVRGQRPGKASLVPVALVGAFVALGGEVVYPGWKQQMAPRIPSGFRGVPGFTPPSGLDATDRGIWLRLYLDGWGPLLEQVKRLSCKKRPHALDALGLARYVGVARVGVG